VRGGKGVVLVKDGQGVWSEECDCLLKGCLVPTWGVVLAGMWGAIRGGFATVLRITKHG
jgi:hypothetical protein